MTELTEAERRQFVANLRQNLGYAISPIIADTLCGHVEAILTARLAEEYQRGYDAGCDDPDSVWTSTLVAERERVATNIEDLALELMACSSTEGAALTAAVLQRAAAIARQSHATGPFAAAQPPVCPDHREAQHRDNKPPWCDSCGWRHGEPARRYGNGRVVA